MSKIFLDTNIFIYAIDDRIMEKRRKSEGVIGDALRNHRAVLSTQVLQEIFVVATMRLKQPPLVIKNYITGLSSVETVVVDPSLIHAAIETSILSTISFWDALVVAAAECAKCDLLYTEDLNHGQVIRGVRVVNPYLEE